MTITGFAGLGSMGAPLAARRAAAPERAASPKAA